MLTMCTNRTDEKYFVEAKLNGTIIRAFVHLGSTCNTIKRSAANELRMSFDPNSICNIKSFGLGVIKTLGEAKD